MTPEVIRSVIKAGGLPTLYIVPLKALGRQKRIVSIISLQALSRTPLSISIDNRFPLDQLRCWNPLSNAR
jgi:hypothetical protein